MAQKISIVKETTTTPTKSYELVIIMLRKLVNTKVIQLVHCHGVCFAPKKGKKSLSILLLNILNLLKFNSLFVCVLRFAGSPQEIL